MIIAMYRAWDFSLSASTGGSQWLWEHDICRARLDCTVAFAAWSPSSPPTHAPAIIPRIISTDMNRHGAYTLVSIGFHLNSKDKSRKSSTATKQSRSTQSSVYILKLPKCQAELTDDDASSAAHTSRLPSWSGCGTNRLRDSSFWVPPERQPQIMNHCSINYLYMTTARHMQPHVSQHLMHACI